MSTDTTHFEKTNGGDISESCELVNTKLEKVSERDLEDGLQADKTDGRVHSHHHTHTRREQCGDLVNKYKAIVQMVMLTFVLVMIIYNMRHGTSNPSEHLELLYKIVEPTSGLSLAGLGLSNGKDNTTN